MKIDIEDILYELDDLKYEFELDGVELTEEDALAVVRYMDLGESKKTAMALVLAEIREVLDDGLE